MKSATLILLALMIMLPATLLLPEPPQKDVPAQMEAARGALQNARKELTNAGGEWGGHRIAAINHIDAALKEIGEGEKWAREHHDIK
jgi:hypothetical protein